MILIGIGCSPVLMASYYIFARSFSPAVFGTLAGMVIGIGSLGNLAASVPLRMAVEALGWRGTMWGLAAVTLVTALAVSYTQLDVYKRQTQVYQSDLSFVRSLRLVEKIGCLSEEWFST